jgi:hypothetical protein
VTRVSQPSPDLAVGAFSLLGWREITTAVVQQTFRRSSAAVATSQPPHAKIRPGRPALAMGPGTGAEAAHLLLFLTTLVNPAAALGDEALGKRGGGCRASPLLRRGPTVQTLAKVYEDRAAECSRAAQQTDDPVFRRLLLMLASQWKLAAQEEAKSKDAPTSLASTQPQPLDESRSCDGEPIRHAE